MGLDIGDRWIGVALSDPTGTIASPHGIIERSGEQSDIQAILDLARQHQVGLVIVGLPRSMAGGTGEQALKVMEFVARLRERTGLPIEFRDERLTTVSARRLLAPRRGRKGRGKPRYDAAAAAIILQSYLEEGR